MKYSDVKIISKFPNTSKIKTPVIVIIGVEVREDHRFFDFHIEYIIRIYYPMIKTPFKSTERFKTFRKVLNVTKKIASITNTEIVKMED